jgi:hypothetical protein
MCRFSWWVEMYDRRGVLSRTFLSLQKSFARRGVISLFESFGGNARSSFVYFTDPLLSNASSVSLECDMNYLIASVIYKMILDLPML